MSGASLDRRTVSPLTFCRALPGHDTCTLIVVFVFGFGCDDFCGRTSHIIVGLQRPPNGIDIVRVRDVGLRTDRRRVLHAAPGDPSVSPGLPRSTYDKRTKYNRKQASVINESQLPHVEDRLILQADSRISDHSRL